MPELVVDQVLSGFELGLDWGLTDLLILDIGGRIVVYALSRSDGAVVELTMAPDGTLVPAGDISLSGAFLPGTEPALVEGQGALLLAGMDPSPGQVVTLGGDGSLGVQSASAGLPTLMAPVTFALPGGNAIVTGRGGGGIDLWLDSGGFSKVSGLDDTADLYLAEVSETASFLIGGTRYVAAVSASDHGVTLTQVSGAGTLMARQALGLNEYLPVGTPTEVEAVQRLGETQLVVGASGSSSLTVLDVDAWGVASAVDHILDDGATRFQSVTVLDAVTHGDFAYLVAGGADGGVSLFTLLPGGRLVHLASFVDDDTTTLYRVSSVALSVQANELQIVGGSAWEAGITRLSYDLGSLGAVVVGNGGLLSGTAWADQIIGSDVADDIDGGTGDDVILDGAGSDTMRGGAGADLFLFEADGATDSIIDFEKGVDRLDISDFDFLYDVGQLEITPTPTGAVITFSDETILIETSDGSSLSFSDFGNEDILNVDRPALGTVIQNLTGTPAGDILTGGDGNDRIDGSGGNDHLFGGAGMDLLLGGDGFDTIEGGEGNDTIGGGAAPDTLSGGAGDDFIEGDAGGDVIYGDEMI